MFCRCESDKEYVNKTDLRSGELPPIGTGSPNKRNSVRTTGGTYGLSVTRSGKNAVTPLTPPKNISARALVVDAEIVELVARQPIVGVVVLEGPGPRVEFGQAVPGAQPQVARGVFEDALYGVVRQTVALVENCKLAGLGVIPIQSVLGADPELARSVHAQGVHAIVAKGSLDGGIVPVTDNLARPLVQALQAPLVGAEPDRSVRPFRNDSIDPAGRWACIS